VSDLLKVMLVAQTPPPYGGQAVMMQKILEGEYVGVSIRHVRMAFSRDMREVGRLKPRKVIHLLAVIGRVVVTRVRFGASTLYYPPAGPDKVPMYRDLILLLATRWMFKKTIFHFEAGGLSELYPTLPPWLKPLFRTAYFGADLGIRTDRFAPEDPARLEATREAIIPNAVDDVADSTRRVMPSGRAPSYGTILFVGVIRESKGAVALIEACGELKRSGLRFRLQLMGEFESEEFENRIRSMANEHGVDFEYLGVRTGPEKYFAYAEADIFCLPSFFESESGPVVLVEAMQFGLPIVSTNWRGIPAMVSEGVNGFLVPVRDIRALADRLRILLTNPELAGQMGAAGRRIYEAQYTLQGFHENLQAVFDMVRDGSSP
jgi:glycosyltransferase involved in cell wall biosynthesis